jgi:hypothetical protein
MGIDHHDHFSFFDMPDCFLALDEDAVEVNKYRIGVMAYFPTVFPNMILWISN